MANIYIKVPQMKVLFVISAIVSMASAGVGPIVILPSSSQLLRSPHPDSAIVQSEQLGGNFAYAIAEGQSFRTVPSLLNFRAFDDLGVSYPYGLNSFPILTAPTILLRQPTSEEEQREQQKAKDFLQKQRDELQEALDRQREDDGRQLQEQIDQQNLLNQQALEQQKQLIELQQQWQQEQQNFVANAGVISVPVSVGIPVNTPDNSNNNNNNINIVNNDNNNNNNNNIPSDVTDDSIVVENTSLTKDQNANGNDQSQDQPADDGQADRQTKNNSDAENN